MRKAPKYEVQNLLVLCCIRLLSGGYKRIGQVRNLFVRQGSN